MQPANMAYDRAITVFSPDGRLFQVEYAREAVKRGTTTVGIKYKTGVVLIVDKRVTSRLIEPASIEKIFEIDNHIGCATSGLVADARALIDRFKIDIDLESFNGGKNRARYYFPLYYYPVKILEKMKYVEYGGRGKITRIEFEEDF